MRLRVFRDKKGRVIATAEEPKGKAVSPQPVAGKGVTVEGMNAPKEYTGQIHVFYRSLKGKPKRRKSVR